MAQSTGVTRHLYFLKRPPSPPSLLPSVARRVEGGAFKRRFNKESQAIEERP